MTNLNDEKLYTITTLMIFLCLQTQDFPNVIEYWGQRCVSKMDGSVGHVTIVVVPLDPIFEEYPWAHGFLSLRYIDDLTMHFAVGFLYVLLLFRMVGWFSCPIQGHGSSLLGGICRSQGQIEVS